MLVVSMVWTRTQVYVRKVFLCGNSWVVTLPEQALRRTGYGYVKMLVRDKDVVIARLR